MEKMLKEQIEFTEEAIANRFGWKFVPILTAVDKFYDNPSNFAVVCSLLARAKAKKRKSLCPPRKSLKLLDFALGTYSLNGALVTIDQRPVNIHNIYRAGVNAYGRAYYDTFRRGNGFVYHKHGRSVHVSIAQLLLFRDLIRYRILQWIDANIADIKRCMDKEHTKGIFKTKKTRICDASTHPTLHRYTAPIKLS